MHIVLLRQKELKHDDGILVGNQKIATNRRLIPTSVQLSITDFTFFIFPSSHLDMSFMMLKSDKGLMFKVLVIH